MSGLTPLDARIALLIADPRNLSYREIGATVADPPIAARTVKARVRAMSRYFDADSRIAFPPRVQILVWVRHVQWALGRAPTLDELIRASGERDV